MLGSNLVFGTKTRSRPVREGTTGLVTALSSLQTSGNKYLADSSNAGCLAVDQ